MAAFINELHYDNAGTDQNEGFEIAGTAGTDLTGWSVVFYNGNNPAAGMTYATVALSGVIGDQQNGFGTLAFAGPASGIQNGGNDGFALVDASGNVIQFLSYEGTMVAANGPATGRTSIDIGVSENGTGAATNSLRLTGTGTQYSDFTWAAEAQSSFGSVNQGQTFGAVTPTLSVNDVSVAEGDAGTTLLTFTVTRTGTGAVSVNYATADGTATAGSDYVATAGTLNFASGETSKTVTVAVNGDTAFEPNETVRLLLSNATAGVTIADGEGIGTIVNDDAAPAGTLSIAGASLVEGNSGTSQMLFTVTRADGSTGAVSASYTVNLNGTASAADLTGPLSGTVSFADGETSRTISVGIVGDTAFEANETFGVTLSAPTGGAALGTATATGTIVNDDAAPATAPLFINEIHYDPVGTDSNEKIEIAGPAGTDLSGWKVVLYNGNGGAPYDTKTLSGTIADQGNGYGTAVISYATNGIQNGSPDGIALVAPDGQVVQFLSYEGTMTAVGGPADGMVSTDIGVFQENAPLNGSLQLQGTGAVGDDFTWVNTDQNTFGQQNTGQTFLTADGPGYLRIADRVVAEGNAGTTEMTFTVSRSGGSAAAATVDYNIALTGSASQSDFAPGQALSGQVSFGIGEYSKTITVLIAGDTTPEPNETFEIRLANPTGNTFITDGVAVGTIRNDDPITLKIYEIQGAGHISDYVGQQVTTTGIVTAVGNSGYYIQDAIGDGNANTSDAIFVATSGKAALAVGSAVTVSGTVAETGAANALKVTTITGSTVTVDSTGNDLPAAVVIGIDGRQPPTEIVEDDNFTAYQPATDGLDFYETMEGMRVTLDAPLVVSNTVSGDTWTVASGGVGATGVAASGGITISAGDYNPERLLLDSVSDVFGGFTGSYTRGDQLADVTGVLTYSSAYYRLIPTEATTQTVDVTLQPEVTDLVGDENHLTVASFNMENVDPTDGAAKFNLIADSIVNNLRAPDIILAQEIQDADGAGSGTNYSGTVTANLVIQAIQDAGGPTYAYVEVAPTGNNQNGGEPNGNIRPGIFYRVDRVDYVEGSAQSLTGDAYAGTRKPLVADFVFNGQKITAIDLHSTSRLGSDPLNGSNQPPFAAGDAARTAQAQGVRDYIDQLRAADPDAHIVVGGDFNGFDFERALQLLVEDGAMTNLNTLIPVEERYSYEFEGNLQQIDHLLVSSPLLDGASFDAVHINTVKTAGTPEATDHDQIVTRLYVPQANRAPVANDDAVAVNEDATTGNLVAQLLGNDTDADGNPLRIVSVGTAGTAGTVVFDADTQTLRYVADADSFDQLKTGATAPDSFTYTVSDGTTTSTATVAVTVTGIADGVTRNGGSGAENLTGTTGEDRLYGNGGNDTLAGGQGADFISGGIGNDSLSGDAGRDTLLGGAGTDRLFGGAGDDYLSGDAGNDTLTGGLGADTFAFGVSGGRDTIADFDTALDRILLASNLSLTNSTVGDVNRDGVADLTLTFTGGTSAIVLGVSDISAITIVRTSDPLITDPTL